MSYNNSDKEFYYALHLKFYKERLEKILNVNFSEVELDKNINGRKVDLYAVAEDNREVFIELQLNTSDDVHLNQIFTIIEMKELNNIVLVWGAIDFKSEMLDSVEAKIKVSGKNIHFVALKINEKVIDYLKIINNNIFINDIIDNLKIINEVQNQFKIIEIFYRLQDANNAICVKKQEETLDLNIKLDVMKYILIELRRQIHYYPSVYRGKKLDNNLIVLAGGKAEILYNIGINRKNYLFVSLNFGELRKEMFTELLEKKEEINDKLDYLSEFDLENRRIVTYLYFDNGKKEMVIKQIVRITDKYIRFFSQYTYNNKLV